MAAHSVPGSIYLGIFFYYVNQMIRILLQQWLGEQNLEGFPPWLAPHTLLLLGDHPLLTCFSLVFQSTCFLPCCDLSSVSSD